MAQIKEVMEIHVVNPTNGIGCTVVSDDSSLSAEQLDDKYNLEGDGEHPRYVRHKWVEEVIQQRTLLGYWDWVVNRIGCEIIPN